MRQSVREKRSDPKVKEHEAECKRQKISEPKVKEHQQSVRDKTEVIQM